jgi:hypothetical protein
VVRLLLIVLILLISGVSYSYDYKVDGLQDSLNGLALEEEKVFIDIALSTCWNGYPKDVDFENVLNVLRNDENVTFTDKFYGISLAIWCIEGAFRTKTKNGGDIVGDFREGRGFLSHGPLQIMANRAAMCGGDTDKTHDVVWASSCWISEYHRVYQKYSERLKFCNDEEIPYIVEALTSNYGKYKITCDKNSKSCTKQYCKTRSQHTKFLQEIQDKYEYSTSLYGFEGVN